MAWPEELFLLLFSAWRETCGDSCSKRDPNPCTDGNECANVVEGDAQSRPDTYAKGNSCTKRVTAHIQSNLPPDH